MTCKPQFPAVRIAVNRPGYALLLAVLITSAVLSSATALASVVIAEIRQTRDVASAIVAYAQAEAQVDKGIFMLRHTDLSLDDVAGSLDETTVTTETRPQYFQIPQNDFVSLSIPQGVALIDTPRIISWDLSEPTCVSWIEVTTVAWNTDPLAEDPFSSVRQPHARSEFTESGTGSLSLPFIPMGEPVEMRIRALYCDIAQLGVEGIPGRVRIAATGVDDNVQQAVETLIVRYPPAAGFADFAIFSECSVIKGEPLSPDCPQ